MKTQIYSSLVLMLVMLVVSPVSGLDPSLLGVSQGDAWTYHILNGEYQYSENGKLLVAGDQYEYKIVSAIADDGTYTFEIGTDDHRVRGSGGNMGILGNEVVLLNWTYWEEEALDNLEDTYLSSGELTLSNEENLFHLTYEILDFIYIEMVYFKDTGVLKSLITQAGDEVVYSVEVIAETPAYGLQILGLSLALIALFFPSIRKWWKNRVLGPHSSPTED